MLTWDPDKTNNIYYIKFMRFLVICYTYPGRISSIVNWLAQQPGNEVILASNWNRSERKGSNIRCVTLKRGDSKPVLENSLDYWTDAIQLAKKGIFSFSHIGKSGFTPDIILVATGNGSALGLRDIFPGAFIVNYLEPLMSADHQELSAWDNVQIIQSLQSNLVFSFTTALCKNFAKIIRKPIGKIPLCVNTNYFLANKGSRRNSIIMNFHNFNERNLNFWLERLLKMASAYTEYQFIILLRSMAAKRKFEQRLSELQVNTHHNIKIECETSEDVNLEVYSHGLLYISPSIELQKETLEAMSCEIPVMAHIAEEFLQPGINCLDIKKWNLLPKLLSNLDRLKKIGINGRKSLLNDFDCHKVIQQHVSSILDIFHGRECESVEELGL